MLANSAQSRGDPTDLIAQTLCQELFDMQPRVALPEYARECARKEGVEWSELVREWEAKRVLGTRMGDLADYTGTYLNEGCKLAILVRRLSDVEMSLRFGKPELLESQVNSLPRQTARLRHYTITTTHGAFSPSLGTTPPARAWSCTWLSRICCWNLSATTPAEFVPSIGISRAAIARVQRRV